MAIQFLGRACRRATRIPQQRFRLGVASIEVVLATATSFATAALLAGAGIRACRNLYHTIANLVGWPFL